VLISFSVSNFRSFGEEVTLSMVANNKLTDHRSQRIRLGNSDNHVLRAAVLYGANAAGKSNLVKAMEYAQSVIGSTGDSAPDTDPFRFDESMRSGPSCFEFQFFTHGLVCQYGFDISSHGIISEWLTLRDPNTERESIVFERGQDGQVAPNLTPELDDISGETLESLCKLPLAQWQLLLNRLKQIPPSSRGKVLGAIISWLVSSLVVIPAGNPSRPGYGSIIYRLANDPTLCSLASGFMAHAGTGISRLSVTSEERDPDAWQRSTPSSRSRGPKVPLSFDDDILITRSSANPGKVIVNRLFAEHTHANGCDELPFSEESDGTKHLLGLTPILASKAGAAKVYVIDELDRSLHPILCWEFIRLFCGDDAQGGNSQLIVTTHEAHLLNQELLRRDEYWFVEKDESQQTRLVSLAEFKLRNDLVIEKGYLQGRFGAIPIIGSSDRLRELLQPGEDQGASDAT
jgi:uncharacterized protein